MCRGLYKLEVIINLMVQLEINITLFNHVGMFHDFRICQLRYVMPPNKVQIFVYYSYIQVDIWKFGWSYAPVTVHMNRDLTCYCIIGNIVHLGIIHSNIITVIQPITNLVDEKFTWNYTW